MAGDTGSPRGCRRSCLSLWRWGIVDSDPCMRDGGRPGTFRGPGGEMSTLAVTSACQSTRILRWAILTGHTMRGILRNVPTQLSQPNTEPPTGLWGEETSELGLMKRGEVDRAGRGGSVPGAAGGSKLQHREDPEVQELGGAHLGCCCGYF